MAKLAIKRRVTHLGSRYICNQQSEMNNSKETYMFFLNDMEANKECKDVSSPEDAQLFE